MMMMMMSLLSRSGQYNINVTNRGSMDARETESRKEERLSKDTCCSEYQTKEILALKLQMKRCMMERL